MQIRSRKDIIRNLYKKYAIIEDNTVYADKLFIINTVINYIFKDKEDSRTESKKLAEYSQIISQYLKDEVDIYWDGDKLLVEPIRKQTSGE